MALWDVWQQTHYLWNDTWSTKDFIATIDDQQKNLKQTITDLFGTTERPAIVSTDPAVADATGIFDASVSWSPQNKPGFVRDREAEGDYIVNFHAVRRLV